MAAVMTTTKKTRSAVSCDEMAIDGSGDDDDEDSVGGEF